MQSLFCALRITIMACFLGFFVAACPSPKVRTPKNTEEIIRFLVVGDNDFHGALGGRTYELTLADGTPYSMPVGGAEYVASYYQAIRKMYANRVILLMAGDIFQGTPVSNHFEGAPVMTFLNYLQYDAVAIGNHEFDYGPKGELSVPAPNSTQDPFGALNALLSSSRFPFLSANIVFKESQKVPDWPNFAPTTLIEREGVRIGIIGLTTESTPTTTQPPNVASLEFLSLADATIRAAKSLRENGAEIILVVAHAGTECKDLSDPKKEDSCDQNEEIPRLLHAIPSGTVDALVSGHTHSFVANFIAGVPVIQSGANGSAFGRIELFFDKKNRTLLREQTKIHPPQQVCQKVFVETENCDKNAAKNASGRTKTPVFLSTEILPDKQVSEFLESSRNAVKSITEEILGKVEQPITRKSQAESAMGDLVTDIMREATQKYADVSNASIAIQNSGGLRANLPSGPFTYGDLFKVLPFENILVTMKLSGKDVTKIFEIAIRENRIFQVSGIRVFYRSTPKKGTNSNQKESFDDYTHQLSHIETKNGTPLDPKAMYTIVWNDFLANGGNGMKELVDSLSEDAIQYHYNLSLRDVAADFMRSYSKPLNTKEAPLLDTNNPRIIFNF